MASTFYAGVRDLLLRAKDNALLETHLVSGSASSSQCPPITRPKVTVAVLRVTPRILGTEMCRQGPC